MRRSIFSRLLLSHIAVIILTGIIMATLTSYLVRAHAVESKRQDLLSKGYDAVELILPDIKAGKLPTPEQIAHLNKLTGAKIWLMDHNYRLLAGQPPERWAKAFPEPSQQFEQLFAGQELSWVRTSRNQLDRSVVIALPVTEAPAPLALFLYAPLPGIHKTAETVEQLQAYSALVGLVTAILLGWIIARGLTRPIADISRAASRFAKGDFTSRTIVAGSDEIGQLGQTFNNMAASLAQVDQNRRDFLANVSHEIRTPVASIQAMSEAMLDGLITSPERQHHYLTTIVQATDRIDHLLQDLLDLAQLDAGELSISSASIDLAAYLTSLKEQIDNLMEPKQLRLHLELPHRTLFAFADPDRLSQALFNLVTNAIRYAPEHTTITITLTADMSRTKIAITDEGPGIAAEEIPYIWDRFYRVEKSRTRKSGGTGLGLAITRQLILAMDGEVAVESTYGNGATFSIMLPQK